MKILLLEDNKNERDDIIKTFADKFPEAIITAVDSYEDGVAAYECDEPDLVITDGEFLVYGSLERLAGLEFLRFVRSKDQNKPVVYHSAADTPKEALNIAGQFFISVPKWRRSEESSALSIVFIAQDLHTELTQQKPTVEGSDVREVGTQEQAVQR